MATSSAVPDDLYTYSNACVNLDNQLQGFAQGTLQQAIEQYRMRCPSFPLPGATSDFPRLRIPEVDWAVEAGGPWLPNGLASYAANNANVDAWVGSVADAFVNTETGGIGEGDTINPEQIRLLQRDAGELLTVEDAALADAIGSEEAAEQAAVEYAADMQQEQAGAALAARLNADAAANGFLTDGDLQALRANLGNPYFDAGVLNSLSQQGRSALDGYLLTPGLSESDAQLVAQLFADAYSSGAVDPSITQQLYQDLVVDPGDGTGTWDQYLMPDLAADPVAASYFLSGLSPDQIQSWSTSDQGFVGSWGPFEQMCAAAAGANWQAFANYAAYTGPLDPQQLAAMMYGATRDDQGRQAVTDSMGDWFVANGGAPQGSDPASVCAWVSQLTNMNGAIASPTGAYLQNIEDWIQAGKFAATEVAVFAATAGVFAWVSAAVSSAVADSTFAAAWDAGLTFESSFGAAVTSADDAAEIIEQAKQIYDLTDVIRKGGDALQNAIDGMPTTDGIKSELSYYYAIMDNTFHEAVARLVQEGWIVGPDGRPVPDTGAEVTTVLNDANDYYVQAPGSTAGPTRTPVSTIWASIFAQFTSSH